MKLGDDTLQDRRIAEAVAAGREAYRSRCGYSNQWAGLCAEIATDCGLRAAVDYMVREQHLPSAITLDKALDWIEPMNEAARRALALEFARLGTFRETLERAA